MAQPAIGAPVASATAKSGTYTVVIEGTAYTPETLTVKRGESVVWFNKDPFPHTVTAKGAFDSHDVAPGKQWKYTPRKAGEYPYTCALHPNMKGILHVELPAVPAGCSEVVGAPDRFPGIGSCRPAFLVPGNGGFCGGSIARPSPSSVRPMPRPPGRDRRGPRHGYERAGCGPLPSTGYDLSLDG